MSKYAASRPPSKLGIKPGRTLSAQQAIYSLVTKSANDVATAIAEHLGGSESKFAQLMTKRARQLGMRRTTFRNASGLTAKGQVTTAKDMALLGIALREHFPKYYRYFSTRSFKYGKKKYGNHNRLLGRGKGRGRHKNRLYQTVRIQFGKFGSSKQALDCRGGNGRQIRQEPQFADEKTDRG